MMSFADVRMRDVAGQVAVLLFAAVMLAHSHLAQQTVRALIWLPGLRHYGVLQGYDDIRCRRPWPSRAVAGSHGPCCGSRLSSIVDLGAGRRWRDCYEESDIERLIAREGAGQNGYPVAHRSCSAIGAEVR